jgi:inner membrane protein
VDPITHALASYSLTRALFPRARRSIQLAAVLGGTAANLDDVSSFFGPAAYLKFHRTYLHSLVAALIIGVVIALVTLLLTRYSSVPPKPKAIFAALLLTALLHPALDLCQSESVELFWPFFSRRLQTDWVAHLDVWIIAILLAGILLPQLSALVSDEIGAKSKAPRGRIGARVALAVVIIYIGARAQLHSNVLAALDSRTYHAELPHRIAALPQQQSPLRWIGVVETQIALHEVELNLAVPNSFDPESALTSYKPEPSPILDAARQTEAARLFLAATRFPKASLERTPTGYHVELRSFPFNANANSTRRVKAIIDTDPTGRIQNDELAWDSTSK